MKNLRPFYAVICAIILFSCEKKEEEKNVPEAFQNKSVSFESSRYDTDLVENIYADILKNDKNLQKLDDEIRENEKKKIEARKAYTQYSEKSENYYNSVKGKAEVVQDSVIRHKLLNIISASEKKFESTAGNLKKLNAQIDANSGSIDDNYALFKVMTTLPFLEKYQKEALPNSKSIEDFLKEQSILTEKVKAKNK